MTLISGAKLGPYEIQSLLGAGGMGEVYLALDSRLKREVAIKILPAHLTSDSDLRARFAQEAQSVCALRHPNICVVHDIGSQNGVDFMVMEFVTGQTLDRVIQGGCPPTLLSSMQFKSRMPSPTLTARESFTATSSPRTSSWKRLAW